MSPILKFVYARYVLLLMLDAPGWYCTGPATR